MLAAAPSKVPFYIAGGVLVAWAVLLAVWGTSHHEFPGSAARGRMVMLTSFVLVLATVTTAVLTGGEGEEEGAAAGTPEATGRTLELAADPGGQLAYDETSAAVLAGRVTVRLANESDIPHNVTIAEGSRDLGETETITGDSATTQVELAAGEYDFYCSVPGHRAAGMEGMLTVE
jgi:plastocyanin